MVRGKSTSLLPHPSWARAWVRPHTAEFRGWLHGFQSLHASWVERTLSFARGAWGLHLAVGTELPWKGRLNPAVEGGVERPKAAGQGQFGPPILSLVFLRPGG